MIIFNDKIVYVLSGLQKWVGGITIFPFIFLKDNQRDNKIIQNHERIHIWQQAECLLILFPIIYFGNYGWLRLIKKMDHMTAYKNICFEKEAYSNQKDLTYIKNRSLWAWMRHN
jgi:hypothetical protein